jgi:uncharacterized RDD family membrane protein YckC
MLAISDPVILYARLLPRAKALVFDLFLYVVAITLLVIVASVATTALLTRSSAITLVLFLISYEPFMVWRFGGTLGHMRYNLRVVSDKTGQNPSLVGSLARWFVKGLLGILSFFFMALTQRHQALHDALSRTTVQVREASSADPDHFVLARTGPVGPADVSRLRRSMAIVVYEAVLFGVVSIASIPFVSDACVYQDICSDGENLFFTVLGAVWLLAAGSILVVGWKGRLWGARSRVA